MARGTGKKRTQEHRQLVCMQGWLGRCAGRQEAPEYALHTARSKARTNADLVHLNCCSETEKPEGALFNTEFGCNHCLNRGKTYFANEAPPGEKKQIQRLTLNEEQSCVVGLFMRGGSWSLVTRASVYHKRSMGAGKSARAFVLICEAKNLGVSQTRTRNIFSSEIRS